MLYHIKIEDKNGSGECITDLNEEILANRFINPYYLNEALVINGVPIEPRDIRRIRVFESDTSLESLIKQVEMEDENDESPYKIFNSAPVWRAIERTRDVTNNYITKAPGQTKRQEQTKSINLTKDSKKVFVVHGHDIELKNDVELFLKSIDLDPIVLHRQVDEGLTIIEKFEKHANVNYAIVLLTPDDFGFAKSEAPKVEKDRKIEARARQNVIFEFGYFIGKLSRQNVCCIYKHGVTLPSDLSGYIYKEVNRSVEEVGLFLMKELKNSGLQVKFQ